MAYPDDLLEQAFSLAKREPRRPKQASLRRAVSSAYYALFHLLISEAVSNWREGSSRMFLTRAFEHGVMKTAARRAASSQQCPFPGENPKVVSALRTIADNFAFLQEKRHAADYDMAKDWTRTEVLDLIRQVELDFGAWRTIRNERIARDFLATLLVKKRD